MIRRKTRHGGAPGGELRTETIVMKDAPAPQSEALQDTPPLASTKHRVIPRKAAAGQTPAQPTSRLDMMRRAASDQMLATAPKRIAKPLAPSVEGPEVTPPMAAGTTLASDIKVPAKERPDDLWQSLPHVPLGTRPEENAKSRARLPLIDYFRADPIAKGFDLLRTRLLRTIRSKGWRKIAVVAPTPGCGTTFTAVNLALSLARVKGTRTVLMDLNQRAPGIAEALGIRTAHQLDRFLRSETRIEAYVKRPSDTLAVGLTETTNAFAAEILQDPLAAEVLDDMIDRLHPDLAGFRRQKHWWSRSAPPPMYR